MILGIVNSDFGWRIESSGYQDQEPFEIMVEREDVKKWFLSGDKKGYHKRRDPKYPVEQSKVCVRKQGKLCD